MIIPSARWRVCRAHSTLTVTSDIAVLILSHGEKGRPFSEVMHVEVDVVILRERVKICEIHFEQIMRLTGTERSHDSN